MTRRALSPVPVEEFAAPRRTPLAARRPKLVLGVFALVLVLSALIGADVQQRLTGGGFESKAAESTDVREVLQRDFNQREVNLVLVVRTKGNIDGLAPKGRQLEQKLADEPGVEQVVGYWTTGSPGLRSPDGTAALILGNVNLPDKQLQALVDRYTQKTEDYRVDVAGGALVLKTATDVITKDLGRAEAYVAPLTLLLLVVVFGSLVAATLPLAVGMLSILVTLAVLRLITGLADVSLYALNLTTALGLGLAIDYSLLMVNRFREELAEKDDVSAAVTRTVRTAGRTVVVSALTVSAALVSLLVFPMMFLRSFVYAGVAVVAVAAAGAVILVPAVLTLIGPRVNRLALFRRRDTLVEHGRWFRVAMAAMQRPWLVTVGVVTGLVILGLPFLQLQLRTADERVLPADSTVRQVSEYVRAAFGEELSASPVLLRNPSATEVARVAEALSRDQAVSRVDTGTGVFIDGTVAAPAPEGIQYRSADGDAWMSVVPSVMPNSDAAEALLQRLRSYDRGRLLVGGVTATSVDARDTIVDRLPAALGLIAVTTFVLLFLMFGSVLLPIKALVLNTLSLTGTFGAMVWIFQEGHLEGLLPFEGTGSIETTIPVLLFCIAFGLSMDYEVFLLARIKEEHDRGASNQLAVARGLQRSARIITAAALLLAVVFMALATSRISFIQLLGVGLAVAVLVDAAIVRPLLVPAVMRLAGNANWWAPAPLRRWHQRWGLHEVETAAVLHHDDAPFPRGGGDTT